MNGTWIRKNNKLAFSGIAEHSCTYLSRSRWSSRRTSRTTMYIISLLTLWCTSANSTTLPRSCPPVVCRTSRVAYRGSCCCMSLYRRSIVEVRGLSTCTGRLGISRTFPAVSGLHDRVRRRRIGVVHRAVVVFQLESIIFMNIIGKSNGK